MAGTYQSDVGTHDGRFIGNLTRVQHNDRQTISGHIDLGEAQFEIWYKVPSGSFTDGAETLLALTLLPAMRLGKAIRVNAPLSPRLLNALPTVQEILHARDPRFKKVAIHAHPGPPSREPGYEVGLFFSGGLDSFYSLLNTYASLMPWGSHPLLDPLWGTEITELVHDGCEATRVEKARRVSTSDTALRLLQVCWRYRDEGYNWAQCEKCLRTMVNLRIAGVLSQCSAFDRPLDLRAISRMRITDLSMRSLVDENLQAAESSGTDPALAKALRDCLEGRYYRGVWRIARASQRVVRRLARGR